MSSARSPRKPRVPRKPESPRSLSAGIPGSIAKYVRNKTIRAICNAQRATSDAEFDWIAIEQACLNSVKDAISEKANE